MCIRDSIKGGMKLAQTEEKKAVTSGYWNLFRFNPTLAAEGKNPFHLDSDVYKRQVFKRNSCYRFYSIK